jgi:hypothetical protein
MFLNAQYNSSPDHRVLGVLNVSKCNYGSDIGNVKWISLRWSWTLKIQIMRPKTITILALVGLGVVESLWSALIDHRPLNLSMPSAYPISSSGCLLGYPQSLPLHIFAVVPIFDPVIYSWVTCQKPLREESMLRRKSEEYESVNGVRYIPQAKLQVACKVWETNKFGSISHEILIFPLVQSAGVHCVMSIHFLLDFLSRNY